MYIIVKYAIHYLYLLNSDYFTFSPHFLLFVLRYLSYYMCIVVHIVFCTRTVCELPVCGCALEPVLVWRTALLPSLPHAYLSSWQLYQLVGASLLLLLQRHLLIFGGTMPFFFFLVFSLILVMYISSSSFLQTDVEETFFESEKIFILFSCWQFVRV